MIVWTKIIEPTFLETYLSKTGWRKISNLWRTEWADEVMFVHVPERADPDYNGLVKIVLHLLAELEGRTVAEVFGDIFPLDRPAGVEVLE